MNLSEQDLTLYGILTKKYNRTKFRKPQTLKNKL